MKSKKIQKKNSKWFRTYVSLLMVIGLITVAVNIAFLKHIEKSRQKPAVQFNIQTSDNSAEDTKNTEKPTEPEEPVGNVVKKRPDVIEQCLPAKYGFVWEIFHNNTVGKEFNRDREVSFPAPSEYTSIEGITCFRGNNYRNSASYGVADVRKQKLEKVWSRKIGFIDSWTGIGWTGQPAIVKWPDDIKKIMNIYPDKKAKSDLKEVIYAAMDGKIYFMDLNNGEDTRPCIDTGYPYKGSVTVDPRGYPLLYAGQGIDEKEGLKVEIGFRIFNLIDQKQIYFIDGLDTFAFRQWGAFDSNCLVDSKTDTLFECGENGLFYSIKLNTNFDKAKGSITINPELTKYRYKSLKDKRLGTENSPAFFENFAYFADNEGTLQCINLNNMMPVWIRDVTDDTDSTVSIDVEDNGAVSLYTACEVDNQDNSSDLSYIRKINALSGELIWEKSYKCVYDENVNGGVLASPVIGKNDISNLVIYSIARTENPKAGKLIAFDKKNGQEVWTLNLDFYTWSSPVDIYTKEGKSYILLCDSGGYMYLIEGRTGKILDKIGIEGSIEGSPAVYDNMIVVGTRGQKIWGIKIN